MARLGPTRTQTRPLYRTGGASEGSTITTAISPPRKTLFWTVKVGNGGCLSLNPIRLEVAQQSF